MSLPVPKSASLIAMCLFSPAAIFLRIRSVYGDRSNNVGSTPLFFSGGSFSSSHGWQNKRQVLTGRLTLSRKLRGPGAAEKAHCVLVHYTGHAQLSRFSGEALPGAIDPHGSFIQVVGCY